MCLYNLLVLKMDSQLSFDIFCNRCNVFPNDFRINFRNVKDLLTIQIQNARDLASLEFLLL